MQAWGRPPCPPRDTEPARLLAPPLSLQRTQLLSELSHPIFLWERGNHAESVGKQLLHLCSSLQASQQAGTARVPSRRGPRVVAWDLNTQPQSKSLRDPSTRMIPGLVWRPRGAAVVCFLWILRLSTTRPMLGSCFFPGNQ